MRSIRTFQNPLLLASLLVFPALPSSAQSGEAISVPLSEPGRPARVEASLIMGSLVVEAYDGNEIVVRAESQMEEVEEREEKPRADGLRRIRNTTNGMTVEERENRVRISVESWNRGVDLSIKVPRQTSLKLSTINDGDIEVRGVVGEHEFGNTNGSIKALGISGSVVAQTVNGELLVTFDSVADRPMSFTNLNGDIDITFPAQIKADLRMRSDMGDILTDFDFETQATTRKSSEGGEGRGFRLKIEKEIHARINGGGAEISFKNFNGDILIRRGK